MPTPEELDRLSNAMLGKPRCAECGRKCRSFTALVTHIKDAHPNAADPQPLG